jgi:hypothetical protein
MSATWEHENKKKHKNQIYLKWEVIWHCKEWSGYTLNLDTFVTWRRKYFFCLWEKREKKNNHTKVSLQTRLKTRKHSMIIQIALDKNSTSRQTPWDAEKKFLWEKKKQNQRSQESREIFQLFQRNKRVTTELSHHLYVKTQRLKSVLVESERKNVPTKEDQKKSQ